MNEQLPVKVEIEAPTERIEAPEEIIETGQWYWVTDTKEKRTKHEKRPAGEECPHCHADYEDTEDGDPDAEDLPDCDGYHYKAVSVDRLYCIVVIGSNYAKFENPDGWEQRILFDDIYKRCRLEPDAAAVLATERDRRQQRVLDLMDQVREITKRLGVSPRAGLPTPAAETTTALARLADAPDPKDYKRALVKAKKTDLPALFEQIEKANKALSRWMKAELLPLEATAERLGTCMAEINDRILNVDLYAGLSEEVELIKEGEPAGFDERLHLMQRLLYMDEECLLDYKIGGLDIKSLKRFDKWIAKRKNLERILPFPRCIRAMRVRREHKKRANYGSFHQLLINMRLAEYDEMTFLFIRNGDRLYRMNCAIDFGELIFPDKGEMDITAEMMVCHNRYDPSTWMSVAEYEQCVAEQEAQERKRSLWERAHPFEEWKTQELAKEREKYGEDAERRGRGERYPWWGDAWRRENPHHKNVIDVREWAPFDKTHLHYDECMAELTKRLKHYNRVALIIQGLYDRSDVLHPHPPVKLWTPEGFASAVELVYDGTYVLYDGDPPSFSDYLDALNESINSDSVLIGQEEFWMRKEGEKETDRRQSDYRLGEDRWRSIERYRPYGNPGPGEIAKPAKWRPRKKEAVFVWARDRVRYDRWADAKIRATITVPVCALFNVSAYTPGDYLQFFQDPRTRARYLQWAPMLLMAEEYHAGNVKVQEPWDGKQEDE